MNPFFIPTNTSIPPHQLLRKILYKLSSMMPGLKATVFAQIMARGELLFKQSNGLFYFQFALHNTGPQAFFYNSITGSHGFLYNLPNEGPDKIFTAPGYEYALFLERESTEQEYKAGLVVRGNGVHCTKRTANLSAEVQAITSFITHKYECAFINLSPVILTAIAAKKKIVVFHHPSSTEVAQAVVIMWETLFPVLGTTVSVTGLSDGHNGQKMSFDGDAISIILSSNCAHDMFWEAIYSSQKGTPIVIVIGPKITALRMVDFQIPVPKGAHHWVGCELANISAYALAQHSKLIAEPTEKRMIQIKKELA